jgi:hypothetical protein
VTFQKIGKRDDLTPGIAGQVIFTAGKFKGIYRSLLFSHHQAIEKRAVVL